MDGSGTLVYSDGLALYGYIPNHYYRHSFDSSSNVVADNYATASITSYNLTLINKDFAIPDSYEIMISLPPGMEFIPNPPTLNLLDGFSLSINISESNGTMFKATRAFKGGVPADTTMEMQILNIHNPYRLATNLQFKATIYGESGENYPYFQTTDLKVTIDKIGDFLDFSVIPDDMRVSVYPLYRISFKLRGNLPKDHYIKLTVPPSIKQCSRITIMLIAQGESCSANPLQATQLFEYPFEHAYGYQSAICTNIAGSVNKFDIRCRNPETTKPTGDFMLTAQINQNDSSSIYYESIGSPVTMARAGTLDLFNFTKMNNWMNCSNTFRFNFQKTDPSNSTEIDQITLTLSASLTINSCPSVTEENGISRSTESEVICSGQVITISKVLQLANIFTFKLDKIRNPSEATRPIVITAETGNSGGYLGEIGNFTSQDSLCEYPCKECTFDVTNNCTACYIENNPIFAEGMSMHLLHISSDHRTCVNSCPAHTCIIDGSPNECHECDTNCAHCQGQSTNCTGCYINTFLHLNTCHDSCPEGYSDNKDKWTCVFIQGYEAGTEILVLDSVEVEIGSTYRFILKPEGGLSFKDVKLEIIVPPALNMGNSCFSQHIGDCSVAQNVLTFSNFLTKDYSPEDPPISVDIYDTYNNPGLSCIIENIILDIKTKVNSTIYHSDNISLSSNIPFMKRFTPHILQIDTSRPLRSDKYTTVTHITLTFRFWNRDYSIPNEHKMMITFPPQLTFNMVIPPEYTPMDNLYAGSITYCNHPRIEITGAFGGTPQSADSLMMFSISNIFTNKIWGTTGALTLDIGDTPLQKQFTLTHRLILNITHPAQFMGFSVIPANYITSHIATYQFTVTLGAGNLSTNDQIHFTPPPTVKNCDINTLAKIEGITSPIIDKYYEEVNNRYAFDVPCSLPERNMFTFGITCQNPETTKETANFIIFAKIKDTNHKFYLSSGCPLTMNIPNHFATDIVMTMKRKEAGVKNIFNLTVTRTASYESTEIRQIKIRADSSLNITECSVMALSGMSPGSLTQSIISEEELIIEGFTSLSHIFIFQLIDIKNPLLRSDNIQFRVSTRHIEGYIGEEAETNILKTKCNYPCLTCLHSHPNYCESCFLPSDPVFPPLLPQPYFYLHALSQCVDECPEGYYENDPTTCAACETNCKNCSKIASNCTSCHKFTYLYQKVCEMPPCTQSASCIETCPPHYNQNSTHWLCQRKYIIIIIIYYYILGCHDSCANCSSTLDTGCTFCYPEFLLFWDGHCGKCPSHTYFNESSKKCF